MTPCNDSHEKNSSEPSGRTLRHAFGKTKLRFLQTVVKVGLILTLPHLLPSSTGLSNVVVAQKLELWRLPKKPETARDAPTQLKLSLCILHEGNMPTSSFAQHGVLGPRSVVLKNV